MEPILIIGIIVFTGFILGEFCTHFKLPKVTGYILAGVILNPNLTHFIPISFIENTALVTNISLSFITFSVGGTLFFPKVRSLGKPILLITLFEAEFAFLFVAIVFSLLGPFIIPVSQTGLFSVFIPLSLLIAALASPTDPSATLAIGHQYHAQGEVTSTIMGVAAFDDILGIVNYSLAVALSSVMILHQPLSLHSIFQPLFSIAGAIILGSFFGLILNFITRLIKRETEGVLITLVISLLAICFGFAKLGAVDELLSTMTMGIIVVNYNIKREKLFKILERYTEELIFVLFFTLSAMHLDFSVLMSNYLLIIVFVLFRSIGKFSGTLVGGKLSKSSQSVQKYTS
ncbi:cation:proton antiporter, partial [candidate division KSB1 bacterium]|nr:cation:proton antiporter [candidate division KSB1 bacterium]